MIIKALRKIDEIVQARYQAVADYAFINYGIHVYKLGAQSEMINIACWFVISGFQIVGHDFWLLPLNLLNVAGSYLRGKRFDASSTFETPDQFIYMSSVACKPVLLFLVAWSVFLTTTLLMDPNISPYGWLFDVVSACLISTTYFGACKPLPPSRKKQKKLKGDMAWNNLGG